MPRCSPFRCYDSRKCIQLCFELGEDIDPLKEPLFESSAHLFAGHASKASMLGSYRFGALGLHLLYVALLALVARLPHSFNGACNCELFLHEGLESVEGASSLVVFSLRSSLRRKVLNRRVPTYLAKTGAQFLSVSRAVRIANNDAAVSSCSSPRASQSGFILCSGLTKGPKNLTKADLPELATTSSKLSLLSETTATGSRSCSLVTSSHFTSHGARKESKAKRNNKATKSTIHECIT